MDRARARARRHPALTSPCYYYCTGDEEGVLFIQTTYLQKFKDKPAEAYMSSGEEHTVVVDDAFQYGQDKERTRRWLVRLPRREHERLPGKPSRCP